jgi:sRNA-binding protein
MTAAYCQAILRHEQRITLDGAPAEPVGAEAKDLATKQLGRLATRKAPKKAAKAAASAAVNPLPAAAPPTETLPKTPDQLRDRVRASLLRRSA